MLKVDIEVEVEVEAEVESEIEVELEASVEVEETRILRTVVEGLIALLAEFIMHLGPMRRVEVDVEEKKRG